MARRFDIPCWFCAPVPRAIALSPVREPYKSAHRMTRLQIPVITETGLMTVGE
jgi:hypothetical protein